MIANQAANSYPGRGTDGGVFIAVLRRSFSCPLFGGIRTRWTTWTPSTTPSPRDRPTTSRSGTKEAADLFDGRRRERHPGPGQRGRRRPQTVPLLEAAGASRRPNGAATAGDRGYEPDPATAVWTMPTTCTPTMAPRYPPNTATREDGTVQLVDGPQGHGQDLKKQKKFNSGQDRRAGQ